MALELKITSVQEQNCTILKIVDSTGFYGAVNNPTGWCSVDVSGPNPRVDNSVVTAGTLTITKPSGTEYTFNLMTLAVWQELTGLSNNPYAAGTSPVDLTFSLTEEMLENTIEDGIYKVTYSLTIAEQTYTTTVLMCVYGKLELALFKELETLPEKYFCQKCTDKCSKDVVTVWSLYLALMYAAELGMTDEFTNIMQTIKVVCAQAGLLADYL